MSFISRFDSLPNELCYIVFEFFNNVDLLYSFVNLNRRLNDLVQNFVRQKFDRVDLRQINRRVFRHFLLQKSLLNQVKSLKVTDEQWRVLPPPFNDQLKHFHVFLQRNFHLNANEQILLRKLQSLTVENQALTWQQPLIQCSLLKHVSIHLKSHSDLIDLLNALPVIEKLHVKINYEVSNCDQESSCQLTRIPARLTEFSYEIDSCHGLVYFVTDYSLIEQLIQSMSQLICLRLYVIGCQNTNVDGIRLENHLLKRLPRLNSFHFYFQTYGGKELHSMHSFEHLPWTFAAYTHSPSDMHFLFTVPFQFTRLDQCLNEHFFSALRLTSSATTKTPLKMKSVEHVDLSCDLTLNLILTLRENFASLKSIRFSSSKAEYADPPLFFRQHRYLLPSVQRVIFDSSCRNQGAFLRLLPNLTSLQLHQPFFDRLIDERICSCLTRVKSFHLFGFRRADLDEILHCFPHVHQLVLRTIHSNNDPPVRSFLHNACQHKSRPVSVVDVLNEIFKKKVSSLRSIEIGCVFERDEVNLTAILSRLIRKYFDETKAFDILTEHFHSTRCGTVTVDFV